VSEVPDLVEFTTVSSPRLIAEKYMQNFLKKLENIDQIAV